MGNRGLGEPGDRLGILGGGDIAELAVRKSVMVGLRGESDRILALEKRSWRRFGDGCV
jgi:hypothetical protein